MESVDPQGARRSPKSAVAHEHFDADPTGAKACSKG